MAQKDSKISEEQLRLLVEAMQDTVLGESRGASHVLNVLVQETIKFRDKLKEETGEILTVADTQAALSALEGRLKDEPFPRELSSEQKTLIQIWMDRLTLFDGH
ncbi:MAG: hypothetical protein DRP45_01820 [Candidatus Zixiibacteriota bacterium]|nr:MAG: hypothetical protein DRP45_01820 [candidate division Zixibacteria bacterium]